VEGKKLKMKGRLSALYALDRGLGFYRQGLLCQVQDFTDNPARLF